MEMHDASMGDFETAWDQALRDGAVEHDMAMADSPTTGVTATIKRLATVRI
jgi:hypothetical protein